MTLLQRVSEIRCGIDVPQPAPAHFPYLDHRSLKLADHDEVRIEAIRFRRRKDSARALARYYAKRAVDVPENGA